MCVEVIQHHSDPFSRWKMNFNQILHAPSEILFGALVSDFDVPPTCQGLQKHEQVASTFPAILVVITPWFSISHWQRQLGFAHHLIGHLVKTNHWKGKLIRLSVKIQDIFHAPYESSANDSWDTPFLALPGFEIVF
jgi:hypothetical protein